jgi:hypothetical protein
MASIGQGWSEGRIDIFQEHRATRVLEMMLLEANGRLPQSSAPARPDEAERPLAIGAAPEDDPYTLSGLLCELAVRELGWEVINLGPNLPLCSLAKAIEVHRPRLVWITVSYLPDPERFVMEYARFSACAARLRSGVVLGGQGLDLTVRQQIRSAVFGERIGHLVEYARQVRPDFSGRLDDSDATLDETQTTHPAPR